MRIRHVTSARRVQALAMQRAGTRVVRTTAAGAWTAGLPGLRRGTLAYRVIAVDRVGNASQAINASQRLTRR